VDHVLAPAIVFGFGCPALLLFLGGGVTGYEKHSDEPENLRKGGSGGGVIEKLHPVLR
jgi:hypothetical protein